MKEHKLDCEKTLLDECCEALGWQGGTIHQITQVLRNIKEAQKSLYVLAEAWRGDWNNFDGRELREQLTEIIKILDGEGNAKTFMNHNGISEDKKHKGVYKWE